MHETNPIIYETNFNEVELFYNTAIYVIYYVHIRISALS